MNITDSKPAAWGGLILALLVIVLTFSLRPVWWTFIDIFFMFMAAFSQFVAVYIKKLNPYASKKLRSCAFIFLILWIVALIAEFIVFQFIG